MVHRNESCIRCDEDICHCKGVLRHDETQVKNDSSLEFATTKATACSDEEVRHDKDEGSPWRRER